MVCAHILILLPKKNIVGVIILLNDFQIELTVPSAMAGAIMGKGGSILTDMIEVHLMYCFI